MQLRVDIQRQGPRCPFANETLQLRLESGECFWLRGNSGSGKSSIALHLLGLRTLADAHFEVEWTGIEPERAGFGMVFQQGVLIDSLNVRKS